MGERLQSPKSYICSFFDCKAKFSKSWKLEAHLCKHTGLVSGFKSLEPKHNNEWMTADVPLVCQPSVNVPYVSLTSETILLWELRQALLHSLSTHQTWAQPQWGKATQVSRRVSTSPPREATLILLFPKLPFSCYLLCSSGVSPMDAPRPLSRMPAWRSIWLGFTRRRNYVEYGDSDILLYSLSLCLLICLYWFKVYCNVPDCVPFNSVTIRAVPRNSTRGTNWKPICVSTQSFCLFSKWRHTWCRNWSFVHSAVSHPTVCCSCSFSGCESEFPTHGRLKHHEKVHAGWFISWGIFQAFTRLF